MKQILRLFLILINTLVISACSSTSDQPLNITHLSNTLPDGVYKCNGDLASLTVRRDDLNIINYVDFTYGGFHISFDEVEDMNKRIQRSRKGLLSTYRRYSEPHKIPPMSHIDNTVKEAVYRSADQNLHAKKQELEDLLKLIERIFPAIRVACTNK